VLRIGIWYLAPELRRLIDSGFSTVCDALATGCLLACHRQRLRSPAYTQWIRSRWFAAVPALTLVANLAQLHTRSLPLSYALGQTVMNVCIALCLDRAVRMPEDFFGRILNAPLPARVGVMSYSIYLWQQLFINRNSELWVCAFPMNLVFSVAAGSCSYYLVEKTFLHWRAVLERKQALLRSPMTSPDARRRT
jgi:peptidoglycan/LPS O-acetylase OafA/YrhL